MDVQEEVQTILNSSNILPPLFSNILSSIILPTALVFIMYKIPILLLMQCTIC
jgi:hypothetical protein